MITEPEFRARIEQDFSLTFSIYREKLAYWMIVWSDESEGEIGGPFAGHGHNCSIPYFEYRGWVYALNKGEWVLCRDGQCGWRQGSNPFPHVPENAELTTW